MPKISPEKLEAMRSIGFINGSLPSKPKVREWKTEEGRMKAVTDEAGNTVTQHPSGNRQDVQINATPVAAKAALRKG